MDDIPSSWELDNDDECTATEGSPEDRVGFNVMEDGSVEIGGETWGSTACATLPPPPPPGGIPSTLFGLPIAEFAALVAGGILAVAFLLFCMCKLCEGDGQADQARRMNIQEQQRQQLVMNQMQEQSEILLKQKIHDTVHHIDGSLAPDPFAEEVFFSFFLGLRVPFC